MIDPEKWENIKAIFNEARALPAAERLAFARARGGVDPEAWNELKILLEAVDEAETFIDEPIFEAAASLNGRLIGPYRVVRELGRGGMGVVYLARREGEFEQSVALKVLKKGMDSDEIVRRFNRERQILASLNHPHIARLHDGGTTADGRPFFVMEYVDGRSLTEYCAKNDVSENEKLRLFTDVCAAVSYAHGRLVIHRDLKPSNILVTDDGVAKLLDFGIAKILTEENEAATKTANRLLTPEYASPEQILGREITTAADVYTLGVILYELLDGRMPYEFATRSPAEAMRAICETEPRPPARKLDPDLRNIVLMALRKEPARRYESVEKLRDDIRRYRVHLPVTARADTLKYRTAKFVRRNRAAVAAGLLVFLSLVAGIAATLWQARAARREAAKTAKVTEFLQSTFTNAPFEEKGKDLPFAAVLDTAAARAGTELADEPEVRAEVLETIGLTYQRLGVYEKAEPPLREALELFDGLFGRRAPKSIAGEVALGELLMLRGRTVEARALFEEAIALAGPESEGLSDEIAGALSNLAEIDVRQGKLEDAVTHGRAAADLIRRTRGETNGSYIESQFIIGRALERLGRLEEAESVYRPALELIDRTPGFSRVDRASNAVNLASVLIKLKHFDEARRTLDESRSVFREVLDPRSVWIAEFDGYDCFYHYSKGEYAETIAIARDGMKIFEDGGGKDTNGYFFLLDLLGAALAKTGKAAEGEPILREALEKRQQTAVAGDWRVTLTRQYLGECLTALGKYDEARAALAQSLEEFKTQFGENDYRTRDAATARAALDRRQ